MTSTEIRQGWYSSDAAKLFGTYIYLTADGGQVEVTNVGPGHNYNWPDKVMVGYVTYWLRKGKSGSIQHYS